MNNKTNKPVPPVIKKDTENPEPTEIIAKAIIEVAEAARKLLNSKLKKRAIVLLIKDSAPGPLTMSDIEKVLDAASQLDKNYIK